jgi:hypothetical protein
MTRKLIPALIALLLGCNGQVLAQFLGYTSLQTTQQNVFTGQAANGSSATLTNIGQSSHFLTVCPSSFQGSINLVASQDGTFAAPIALVAANYDTNSSTSVCRVLQAGGYYPTLRVTVTNYVSGSVNAFYTGIAGPITVNPAAANSLGPSTPPQCDKTTVLTIPQNQATTTLIVPGSSSQKLYVCSITFTFNAATTAGTIIITAGTGATCAIPAVGFENLFITANTPQLFQLTYPNGRTVLGTGMQMCIVTTAITASFNIGVSYTSF